jgi:hypothetical protein
METTGVDRSMVCRYGSIVHLEATHHNASRTRLNRCLERLEVVVCEHKMIHPNLNCGFELR